MSHTETLEEKQQRQEADVQFLKEQEKKYQEEHEAMLKSRTGLPEDAPASAVVLGVSMPSDTVKKLIDTLSRFNGSLPIKFGDGQVLDYAFEEVSDDGVTSVVVTTRAPEPREQPVQQV